MRLLTTTAILLFLGAGAVLEAGGQDISPTTGDLHYTAVAPAIDGEFDDAWEASPVFEYPFGVEGHMFGAWLNNPEFTEGEDDFSGHLRVLWDEAYFYLWVAMRDNEPFANGFNECWRNDSVELLLDGGNEKAAAYDANDAYLAFRLGGDVEDWEPNICTLSVLDREKAIANIVYGTAVTDTGWVIEVRVPWENVDVEPANGLNIGFNAVASDADGRVSGTQPQRDVALSWAQHSLGNGWQNPQAMGTMTFVGGPGEAVANAAFTTDPQTRVLLGESITFDASGSTAPAEIVSYEWDFGDGNTGSGLTVSHTYAELGRYIITLSVSDAEGAEGETERAITVWDGIGLPETPLDVPLAASAPEVDGVMEDAWGNAQRIRLSTRANGPLPDNPEDLSAEAWVMWDQDNLYVFFDVTDDDLQNDSPESTWEDDSVEIYLDGDNSKGTAYDGVNDAQFEMGWGRTAITGTNLGVAGAAFAAVEKDGTSGYSVEVLLPWSLVGLENPGLGTDVGFEAMVNDDDGGGSRTHKLSWFAPEGTDLAFDNPGVFGTMRLVEAITISTDPGADVPSKFAVESIYPNPFNPSATAVLVAQSPGEYEVTVYNALGQIIRTQSVRAAVPGRMEVPLNLTGEASGLYFMSIRNLENGQVATAKAMFLK